MKKWAAVIFFAICGFLQLWPCFASSTLELDLIARRARFINFRFGDNVISADVLFQFRQDSDFLLLTLQASDFYFNDHYIPWIQARLTRRGDVIFVEGLEILQYTAKGIINTKEEKLSLDIEGKWREDSQFLKGNLAVKATAWGNFNNILISGYLTVDNGVYEGQEFLKLRLDFLGKPPVFNITDSLVVLHDGSTFEYVNAVLDIRDFSQPFIPNAKFVSQKVYLGRWQVFSEDKKHAGLRRHLSKQVDVFLDTGDAKKDSAGTQPRYNWKDEQFLRLRMEEDRAIFGFEQRRGF